MYITFFIHKRYNIIYQYMLMTYKNNNEFQKNYDLSL